MIPRITRNWNKKIRIKHSEKIRIQIEIAFWSITWKEYKFKCAQTNKSIWLFYIRSALNNKCNTVKNPSISKIKWHQRWWYSACRSTRPLPRGGGAPSRLTPRTATGIWIRIYSLFIFEEGFQISIERKRTLDYK